MQLRSGPLQSSKQTEINPRPNGRGARLRTGRLEVRVLPGWLFVDPVTQRQSVRFTCEWTVVRVHPGLLPEHLAARIPCPSKLVYMLAVQLKGRAAATSRTEWVRVPSPQFFCGVAQWKSAGFIIRSSQVRFLPPRLVGRSVNPFSRAPKGSALNSAPGIGPKNIVTTPP